MAAKSNLVVYEAGEDTRCKTKAKAKTKTNQLPPKPNPIVFVFTRQTYPLEVMYSVDPSSPNVQFAVGLFIMMRPSNFPSGESIKMPPGPVAHKLPF